MTLIVMGDGNGKQSIFLKKSDCDDEGDECDDDDDEIDGKVDNGDERHDELDDKGYKPMRCCVMTRECQSQRG